MAELLTKKNLHEAAITDVASVDKGSKVFYSHTSDAFQNAPHALDARQQGNRHVCYVLSSKKNQLGTT